MSAATALTRADLDRMLESREENHRKTGEALKIATAGVGRLAAAIATAGGIAEAIDSGDLAVAFAEDAAA